MGRSAGGYSPLRMRDGSSNLQAVYLHRLQRLIRVREHHHENLNDEGLWLLDRSIFATYRDCVQTGAGFAANDILRTSPLGSRLRGNGLRN